MERIVLLKNAKRLAESFGHTFIGTEHVLTVYYTAHNPDIVKMLIKRINKRIGRGTPTKLSLSEETCTHTLIDIIKNTNNVDEIILSIITDPSTNGAQFLYR